MSLVTERSGDPTGPNSAEPETTPARPASAERRIPIGMVLGRLIAIPISILVVASISFWLVRASGTNASSQLAGEYATPEQIAAVQETLGLNRSIWAQYGDFLGGLVRGDLGTSYFTTRPVTDEIFDRLPLDLTIGVLALLVAAVVGIAFGAIGAYFRSRWPDRSTRIVISVLQSFPDYVLALVLIYVLFFELGLFPAPIGQISLFAVPPPDVTGVIAVDALLAGQWSMFGSAMEQLALPVLAYGLVLSAVFAKVTRSAFAGALTSGQIQYARACGLTPRRVFWSAFTVSRTSILTTVAIVTGAIVGGGAIMQKIFNLDGAAAFGVDSIFKYDLPVIQGIVIVFGAITIVVFLLVDIAILLLDPRVRHQR